MGAIKSTFAKAAAGGGAGHALDKWRAMKSASSAAGSLHSGGASADAARAIRSTGKSLRATANSTNPATKKAYRELYFAQQDEVSCLDSTHPSPARAKYGTAAWPSLRAGSLTVVLCRSAWPRRRLARSPRTTA